MDFELHRLWGVTYQPTTEERRDLSLSVGQQGQHERGGNAGIDVLLTVTMGHSKPNQHPDVVEVWLTPEQARQVGTWLLLRAPAPEGLK